MKTSLLSLVAAVTLFTSSAASAAPVYDHGHDDPRRMSSIERSRYEAAQLKAQRERERREALERARYEAAQRKLQLEQERRRAQEERLRLEAQRRAQQQAAERARWEAQHRNDRRDDHGYHGR